MTGRSGRRLGTFARAARIAAVYGAAVLLKRVVPISALARWYWSAPRPTSRDELQRREAVLVRLQRLRGLESDDCLEAALVRYRELAKAGRSPRLVLGLARPEGRVAGHAWVEVDGRPYAERPEAAGSYAIVAAFGERGLPVAIESEGR